MSNDKIKSAVAVAGAFLLVLTVGTVGWAMLRPNPSSEATAAWQDATAPASGPPSAAATSSAPPTTPPTTTPPTTTPTPTTTPSKTTKAVIAKPTATKPPPAAERPPAPPPPPPVDPACQPTYEGEAASRDVVKNALVSAAGKEYWKGVRPPSEMAGKPLPKITVPVDLMKAFAYQESGWQSNIIACDGGIGTMQIMPGTAAQVNSRFGHSPGLDPRKLADNVEIGATYIEWLIVYFGVYYYSQNFDLNTVAAVGPDGANLRLLDVVVAAYNVGPGAIEGGLNTLSIPSGAQHYAKTVIALSKNCLCLSW